jgi:hypothetical protein
MGVPLPMVIVTSILVIGLAAAVILVGWRTRAIGPGVFILLGAVMLVLLIAAAAVAFSRRG